MSVKHGLLVLLERGPQYGYQLKSDFDTSTGGLWTLNVGQVYTTLDRLERDGLIVVSVGTGDDEERKSYALTKEGRAECDRWLSEAELETTAPARDELTMKVLLAIEVRPDTALAVIDAQRRALTSQLQIYRRSLRDASTTLAHRLFVESLIARTDSALRWLQICEEKVSTELRPATRKKSTHA